MNSEGLPLDPATFSFLLKRFCSISREFVGGMEADSSVLFVALALLDGADCWDTS